MGFLGRKVKNNTEINQQLNQTDPKVDPLISSAHVDRLKRYRNGVFHFQKKYFDERFTEPPGTAYWASKCDFCYHFYPVTVSIFRRIRATNGCVVCVSRAISRLLLPGLARNAASTSRRLSLFELLCVGILRNAIALSFIS